MRCTRMLSAVLAFAAATVLFVLSAGPATAALIGYWPLDGDGAATVGTAGDLINGPIPAADRNGTPAGALAFAGGSSQYVSVPGGGGLEGSTVGTISMWVQWSGLQDAGHSGSFGAVLGRQKDGSFSDSIISITDTDPALGMLQWRQAGAPAPGLITSPTPVGDGQWRHVAVAFSSGLSDLYLDGVWQGTSMTGGTMNSSDPDPAIPLSIGAWTGGGASFSSASIDDVAIFDDYLSATQIAELAAETKTPLNVGAGGPGFAPLISVTGVTASTQFTGREAIHTVDGSGLIPGTDAHLGGTSTETMWLTEINDPTPTITFNFGTPHTIDAMRIWNYSEDANPSCCLDRGIKTATIEVAGPDGVFSMSPYSIADGDLPRAIGDDTDLSTLFDLGGIEAQFVRITSTANHGDPQDAYTGLSEVRFHGDPVPPLPVTIHSVTSSLGAPFDRKAEYAVDGSGMVGQTHGVAPDGFMWLSNGTFAQPHDTEAEIAFDFGEVVVLDRMKVWNYNEEGALTNRGIRLVDVWVAGEDGQFDLLLLDDFEFAQAPGAAGVDFGQWVELLGTEAQYVKFDIVNNWGDTNQFAGLSEVRFFGVVPEPSSAVLGLLGVFGVALSIARRRHA